MAEAATHTSVEAMRSIGVAPPNMAISRKSRLRVQQKHVKGMIYPAFGYLMWRGCHNAYTYNKATVGYWGEAETWKKYHQHYAHAKCPTDYGRGRREFEYLTVKQGKLVQKPLPKVQYISEKSKPKWLWKSWHDGLGNTDIWRRETEYPEHIPEHMGAKRPLAPLAPLTLHNRMHLAHMEKITITICPFLFGFGHTLQKVALDFYRSVLSARCPFPNEKIFLMYSLDNISPKIEVTWLDGTVYVPPLMSGMREQTITQMIMEQSWNAADRMDACEKKLQPLPIDDYRWEELVVFKKKKKAEEAKAAAPAAGKKK